MTIPDNVEGCRSERSRERTSMASVQRRTAAANQTVRGNIPRSSSLPVTSIREMPAVAGRSFSDSAQHSLAPRQGIPMISKSKAQKLYDEYRKKNIKNRWTVKKQHVRKTNVLTSYHYQLKSHIVERSQTTQCRAYTPGEALSTPDMGRAPKLWKIHCEERDGERVEIPFTSKKITCPICRGCGTENCDNCHGCGKTPCYHCNGDGRLVKTETHQEIFHDGRDPISHCHSRSECCHHCYGQAMQTCASCHGQCRKTCNKCNGSKKVVSYQEMVVKRHVVTDEHYTRVPQLTQKQLKKCDGYKIFVDRNKKLNPVDWNDCLDPEVVKMSQIFLTEHSRIIGRIRSQSHVVTLLPITKVTMEDSTFFWLLGKNLRPSISSDNRTGCSMQ